VAGQERAGNRGRGVQHLPAAGPLALERRSRALHGRRHPAQLLLPVPRSDLAFIERLLAEEGLAWRFEQDEEGAQMVLFADSSQRCAVPEDDSSAASGGIRFHGARVGEQQDTIQSLQASRAACVSLTTLLSYDYKAKRAVGASAMSRLKTAGLLALESYDAPGQYHYANGAQAQRYADLQMQAREARS
jgi:type VI secretion system secreted protein VgrG